MQGDQTRELCWVFLENQMGPPSTRQVMQQSEVSNKRGTDKSSYRFPMKSKGVDKGCWIYYDLTQMGGGPTRDK